MWSCFLYLSEKSTHHLYFPLHGKRKGTTLFSLKWRLMLEGRKRWKRWHCSLPNSLWCVDFCRCLILLIGGSTMTHAGCDGSFRGFCQSLLFCRFDFQRPRLEKGGGDALLCPGSAPGSAVAAQISTVPLTQGWVLRQQLQGNSSCNTWQFPELFSLLKRIRRLGLSCHTHTFFTALALIQTTQFKHLQEPPWRVGTNLSTCSQKWPSLGTHRYRALQPQDSARWIRTYNFNWWPVSVCGWWKSV